MPKIYAGLDPGEIEKRQLGLHEIRLLQRIADQGGAVRIPVIDFGTVKPKDAEKIKVLIDGIRELETRGFLLAEVDDARSEIRVTLLEPSIMLLEARECLKGQDSPPKKRRH